MQRGEYLHIRSSILTFSVTIFALTSIFIRTALSCEQCYEEKDKGAATAADDDIRPWLRAFVESVGHEKAKVLLADAGSFVKLS